MKRNRYRAAALLAATLAVSWHAQAQIQAQPLPQRQPPRTASAAPGNFYAFAGFAALAAEENDQFTRERGSGVNLIAGGGYRLTPNFAVELNVLFAGRRLDTPASAEPPAGTFAAGTLKSAMGTAGLGGTLKFTF